MQLTSDLVEHRGAPGAAGRGHSVRDPSPAGTPATGTDSPNVKRRILFVDDEPTVLAALQRALQPLHTEWDMSFATSGAEALAQMAESPSDVIVTDMRMPGMNGAQLLCEVLKRFPKTARFILSDSADQEFALQCAAAAHQFLSKPCDAATLKSVIGRALKLQHWMATEPTKILVSRLTVLPSLPSLYYEIIDALRDPETSLETIGQLVSRDAAMTAKLLQLGNSAYFGSAGRVATATEAALLLGLELVKSLALWTHIFAHYQVKELTNFSIQALSTHCLSTGIIARGIAAAERAPQRVADDAMTAGLLHDVGKLALAANLPEDYDRVLARAQREPLSLCEAERAEFGASHAEVGAHLLGLWGLPAAIVEATAFHHSPGLADSAEFSPLTAVHVANVLEQERRGSAARTSAQLDLEYLTKLKLQGRLEAWRNFAAWFNPAPAESS